MGIFNERSQRMRSWHRLAASISERPLLCVGMSFYWLWVNMGYQLPLVFKPIDLGLGFALPSQAGPLLASVLSYLVICLAFERRRFVFKSNAYLWIVCALMTCASCLMAVWIACMLEPVPGSSAMRLAAGVPLAACVTVYGLGSLLFGASSACLCIELQRIFGSLGSEHILFHGSVAMFSSVVVIFAVAYAPAWVQLVLFVAAPLPVAACLVRVRRGFTKQELFQRGLHAVLKVPWKLLVTAMLHGLSFGVLLGAPLLQNAGTALLAWNVLSYGLAAVLMLVTAITVKLSFNNLIYQIGFSIVALGLYVNIVFGGPVGVAIQLMGFCFLHLIMWGACAFLIKSFDLPATWVIGCSTCLFMAGQLVGALASGFVGGQPDAGGRLDDMYLTVLVVVLGASLFMMSNRNLRTGWGLATPDTNEGEPAGEQSLVVRTLAADGDLTKRETAVLVSLLRGKNRKAISEDLSISTETAKSHMQNVYRKLGVHSQQELIRLFEDVVVKSER